MTVQNNAAAVVARRRAEQDAAVLERTRFIRQMTPEIAKALPKHLDADRMARLALTVVRKTPELATCTIESFAGALLTASALGLEPGINGEAYLVPYSGECTLIVGYQGYTKLFYQHPLAAQINAHAVRAADEFDFAYGSSPFLRHKPARGERGPIIEYYAAASLSTGASDFLVLSPEEVRELRGGKTGPSGKIPDPQHWMERKTVLRQLVKTMPKSTNLARAIEVDDKGGHELRAAQLAESQAMGELGDAETLALSGAGPTAEDIAAINAEAAAQATEAADR